MTASPPRPLSSRLAPGREAEAGLEDGIAAFRFAAVDPRLAEPAEGRSVLVRTKSPLEAARLLLALDGRARRIVLCPPDAADADLPRVRRLAEVDAEADEAGVRALADAPAPAALEVGGREAPGPAATEWILFTSGTSGPPKLVRHSLEGLLGAAPAPAAPYPVWATFYDLRRYGGLQMLLRAVVGGARMLVAAPGEDLGEHLRRLAAAGVTHVSGTPSHWRGVLLRPEARRLDPSYVRLSGEIADQAVLDRLQAFWPRAQVTHAFASTEAGVVFEVADGREGFPDEVLGRRGEVVVKVEDGRLLVRSPRTADVYLGPDAPPLRDPDGFVDTGDLVRREDGRWRFLGRSGGIINVGGLKVHPEEVERILLRQPGVRQARVSGRPSPVTGSLVVAEIAPEADAAWEVLRPRLETACRAELAPHKRPVVLKPVAALPLSPGGKLARAS